MTKWKTYLKPLTEKKNARLVTRGIANKGFSGMQRVVTHLTKQTQIEIEN